MKSSTGFLNATFTDRSVDTLSIINNRAFVGISGSTGAAYMQQVIKGWTFTSTSRKFFGIS